MGTLLFQVSQPIRSSKDMLVSIDTINKCFLGKIGERYSFKKPESQHDNTSSSESSMNEVMEAAMAHEDDASTKDPVHNVTDEEGLMELFDQFSRLMSPVLDSLEPITVFISEVSLKGKSTTYQVIIQNVVTSVLLDTGANVSVILEKFFQVIAMNTSTVSSMYA